MMDTNEYTNKGKLARDLIKLEMKELVKERKLQKGRATQFRGKNYIYGIWAKKDIDYHAEIFFPLWSEIGDHRLFLVNISYEVLIGGPTINILHPKGRHLKFSIPKVR